MPEDHKTETTDSYAISRQQVSALFVLTFLGMVGLLVFFLILMSARPQGQFIERNTSLYEATIAQAAEQLSQAGEAEDGNVRIPIDQAMMLIVERGVQPQSRLDAPQESIAELESIPEAEATDNTEMALTNQDLSIEQRQEIAASLPDGASVYNNCVACHQATGQGIPGAFPPLVAHAANQYNQAGGPAYLANLILYGLQGEIEVDGQTYNGIMTPWASLSDEEIAAVLNYVVNAWGNDQLVEGFVPFVPADIAQERGKGWTGTDVYDLRQTLGQASESAEAETMLEVVEESTSEAIANEATDDTGDEAVEDSADETVESSSDEGLDAATEIPEDVTSAETTDTTTESIDETLESSETTELAMSEADTGEGGDDVATDEVDTADSEQELEVDAEETAMPEVSETLVSDEVFAIAANLPDGAGVYTNCVACHQATGEGIVGAFPPLVAHAPKLYNAVGGRAYLPQLILQGLQGEIEVEGMTYNSVMTPWASLSDEQIAAVLNYVLTEWDNEQLLEDFVPFVPDDIAEARANPQDTYSLRQALTLE